MKSLFLCSLTLCLPLFISSCVINPPFSGSTVNPQMSNDPFVDYNPWWNTNQVNTGVQNVK